MKTAVIVGQNYPDKTLDEMVEMHDRVIVFEPLATPAAACRAKHEASGKLVVFQAACGEAYTTKTLNIYNRDGLSSSLGCVTEQAKQVYSEYDLSLTGTTRVYVVNLGVILDMMGVKTVDCLVIDAQGMDFTILKSVHYLIDALAIGYIQLEADGDGFRHYAGTPDNSEAAIIEWMSRWPQYKQRRLPKRREAQPDLVFTLELE